MAEAAWQDAALAAIVDLEPDVLGRVLDSHPAAGASHHHRRVEAGAASAESAAAVVPSSRSCKI